ncbi:MAG TPA: hypothetical protein VMT61_10440 [Candidatus Binataceae bacterium]|nr:hypothetical protein [Candidatus Binataceae bacterium]
MPKSRLTKPIGALFLLASAFSAGCAESNTDRANRMGKLLMESGFRAVNADTPKRMEKLGELPPLKLTAGMHKGKPAYWMADPYACQCLWVGGQHAYSEYRQLKNIEPVEANSPAYADFRYDEFVGNPGNETFLGD